MKRIFFLLLLASTTLFSQSELQVSGFFQASLNKVDGAYSVVVDHPVFGPQVLQHQKDDYLSSQVQQLNLFFRKELSESFTAWVNFEVLNSYNSRQGWGNFSLEEAWVNYQYSDAFNVKVGSLIPRFAYLNEIKNRMPLLPYILRPLIYEASISAITTSIYVPEKALVQVSGNIPVGDVTFDYAAFMGNSDKSYIASTNVIAGAGSDTSKFKTFGGRLGAKYGELRFGLSTSFDHQNDQGTINQDVPRSRYAVDFG